MGWKIWFWLIFLPLACATSARAADGGPPSASPDSIHPERVDRLFDRWNSNSTAGGVVAVIRDGAIVHRRAFGMANLDFDVANTPQTLFHIASVAKQFTAFAILLPSRTASFRSMTTCASICRRSPISGT